MEMKLDTITGAVGGLAQRVKIGQLGSVVDLPANFLALIEAGIVKPMTPHDLLATAQAIRRWGASPAAGITAAAARRPDQVALIDELGSLTFGALESRSNSLARALSGSGVGADSSVAIMCRNHRGFVDATFACAKLGATVLLLNTDFARPQLLGVIDREQPQAVIYDSEFEGLLDGAEGEAPKLTRFVSWVEVGAEPTEQIAEQAIARTSDAPLDPPEEPSRFVILTSGTTGTPKGAQRGSPGSMTPLAVLLSKIPMRSERTTVIAAPLFHSWGFANFMFGLVLGSTYVLRRRFDPAATLAMVQDNGADALVVVPVMLQRIMELDRETIDAHPLPTLRITAASGSALPGDLATRWMDAFGDNLYNFYGSTEVGWATIATPEEMRVAPGTSGSPPRGTVIKILDSGGDPVDEGETGRIFVGNEMSFEGYTGGGGKEIVDGMLCSGDVGHFDEHGRLFIDGRDDEMIVSGGENVFPREVEDLLSHHESIDEAAVIGVPDDQFGQRLKAFVVVSTGSELEADAVKAHVKENLARYTVPREVEFLDELPRNPTGKILKRNLS